ncbi:hypothetical protein [Cyanothece sp. BG0011]|uniref:hypothetical protein n=1 Tax=Cyanothece sp. BG0011 TaxID=2082950 RepID=UPI000D1F94BD|nr:hypothetical protein [Cyanothece sp. BG0011]
MSKQTREKAILWLSDEDLELIGVDPATVSDEEFEAIAEELKEFVNEGFQHALIQSVESAKQNQGETS